MNLFLEFMLTTQQQVEQAVGRDKFVVLATAVDQLLQKTSASLEDHHGIDDQIDTLCMDELAAQYEVSVATLRRQITRTLGKGAVLKLGKKLVIRKRRFLEYLQAVEMGGDDVV